MLGKLSRREPTALGYAEKNEERIFGLAPTSVDRRTARANPNTANIVKAVTIDAASVRWNMMRPPLILAWRDAKLAGEETTFRGSVA
jgi:hypothetical protein